MAKKISRAAAAARDYSEDPLLNTAEAARFLNVNERTLEAWRSKGVGPAFVKLRRCARYKLSSLREFAAQGERETSNSK